MRAYSDCTISNLTVCMAKMDNVKTNVIKARLLYITWLAFQLAMALAVAPLTPRNSIQRMMDTTNMPEYSRRVSSRRLSARAPLTGRLLPRVPMVRFITGHSS